MSWAGRIDQPDQGIRNSIINERNRRLNGNSYLSNHEKEHDLKLAHHKMNRMVLNRLKTQPDGGWTVHMLG